MVRFLLFAAILAFGIMVLSVFTRIAAVAIAVGFIVAIIWGVRELWLRLPVLK